METFKKSIGLRCAFCRSYEFALPHAGYSPAPGGFVVCARCGRENDVTSLLLVAKSAGVVLVKQHAQQLVDGLAKDLRKSFRNHKFIKFT
ncbi:TPA: hypothetical protein QEM67_002316 [Pseudomonas putida]|uniref:hypothetical protein n=1 Tax=Pseudomonas putida TaxID=303 RepID=UPI0009EC48E8|nr:hypothetical protein [Pseudomonas putida]HDS1740440.1 hypothetical protein [Pseudomonas putida]